MGSENSAIDKMVNSIINVVKKAVEKEVKCDKTFTASVTEVLSKGKKCRVMYNGTTYTANTTVPVEAGDTVKVTAPCDNWSNLFVAENCSFSTYSKRFYPVGSIYMSVAATDPSLLFGGTWTRIQNTFLLASGSSYAAGATGGEASHTLSVAEMPSHDHKLGLGGANNNGYLPTTSKTVSSVINYHTTTNSSNGVLQDRAPYEWSTGRLIQYVGGSQAHNNMPPYLAVYMWKRIS